jgi:hypothetical protein
MNDATLAAIVTGLVSVLGNGLLNYFVNRKKTFAEIQKVQAEAQKTRAETDKILTEIKSVSANVSYSLATPTEDILFDGTARIDGFDVRGAEGNFWKGSEATSAKGKGDLKFEEGGILNIHRDNTVGRFELYFQRYIFKGEEHSIIPKDFTTSGRRKLRISCEAKAIGGEHMLRFILRDPSSARRLAEDRICVKTNDWTKFQVYLPADPSSDAQLRIDDEEVSRAPSSIQIRNIVLAQRG